MMKNESTIFTKVRGVSHYQSATAWCYRGKELRPVREPNNPHDPNAVRLDVLGGLFSKKYRTVGYVSRDLAERFAPLMDSGLRIECVVLEVTGGYRHKAYRGVNFIIVYDKGEYKRICDQRAIHLSIERERRAAESKRILERERELEELKRQRREQRIDQVKSAFRWVKIQSSHLALHLLRRLSKLFRYLLKNYIELWIGKKDENATTR